MVNANSNIIQLNHWKEFQSAIRHRYGHWSSAERARMLELIKAAERVIEEERYAKNSKD
jgi:hypothetical protein